MVPPESFIIFRVIALQPFKDILDSPDLFLADWPVLYLFPTSLGLFLEEPAFVVGQDFDLVVV